MKNDWPCSSGYFPMRIIWSWQALRKRRCIRQVTVRVSVDEEIISTWEKLFEGDACQGRPMGRCPSVPLSCFQSPSQQVPCVENGFDLSITSFPLLCLSPDGSRPCPSFAESTPSVPLFSLALSLSGTVQTSSGALSRSNTAFLVQETRSCFCLW
jgi:hypothetical protein